MSSIGTSDRNGGRTRASGTLGGLHHHDIAVVVLGRAAALHRLLGLAGMTFQIVPAHADLVADELVAQLEGVEPVGTDRAVPEADDGTAQDPLQLILQAFQLIERVGVLDPLADVEDGGGEPRWPSRARCG